MNNKIVDMGRELQEIRAKASKNQEWAFDEPWEDFIYCMLLLTPQTYGTRIANRLKKELNLSGPKDLDSGDLTHKNKSGEIKVSLITSSNDGMNLVQIRPWQDNDHYIFYCADIRTDHIEHDFFYLNKKDMERQGNLFQSAHGTKLSVSRNTDNEKSIRIKYNSDQYKSWVKLYGISYLNLIEKFK
jgi:hypothetical protein